VPLDVSRLDVDFMSLASHKIHGPAGVGALYARPGSLARLEPLHHGGGQERGLRPGTLPTHQIVGMGEAYARAADLMAAEAPRLTELTETLWLRLQTLGQVHRNGHPVARAPHILNVSFEGVDGEALRFALEDLAVSSGSACGAGEPESSYVLRSLGRDDALAQASLRFSVGRPTTLADIQDAAQRVIEAVSDLRGLAPS